MIHAYLPWIKGPTDVYLGSFRMLGLVSCDPEKGLLDLKYIIQTPYGVVHAKNNEEGILSTCDRLTLYLNPSPNLQLDSKPLPSSIQT